MRLRLAALLSAVLAVLGGCRTPGDTRRDELPKPPGGGTGWNGVGTRPEAAAETDPIKPGHWLHTPSAKKGPGGPAGGFVSNPEPRDEAKGLLAGYVVGPDGRAVKKATIQVEPVNSPGEGAIDYETQTDGAFMIAGLTAGKSYRLTVRHNDEGVLSAGQVLAKVPSVHVRLTLIEGLDLSPVKRADPPKKADPPKPEKNAKPKDDEPKPKDDPLTKPPPAFLEPFDPAGPLPPPSGFAPGGTSGLPTPKPISRDTNLNPSRRTDLPADGWNPVPADPPGTPGGVPYRPDLNTKRPDDGFRPPVVDLPPPLPGPGKQESRRPSADEFYLIDATGKERRFPSGKPGELLLVDFMTTTCVPCQRALPTLTAVQARYADRGLRVAGVTCDDEDLRTRVIFAGKYRSDHAVNFPILTEPGKQPGAVMKKFGVKAYPTAVLLDHTGGVLWQGNPGDAKALVAAIERHLPR